jgi:predicted dehydrogenase
MPPSSAPQRKIRTAIVGLGFGSEFIPIDQRHPHVELVAICQRSRGKLDSSARPTVWSGGIATTRSC